MSVLELRRRGACGDVADCRHCVYDGADIPVLQEVSDIFLLRERCLWGSPGFGMGEERIINF